jgi:hypothetical protein
MNIVSQEQPPDPLDKFVMVVIAILITLFVLAVGILEWTGILPLQLF